MGELTEHILAYTDGHITFETLCAFLADFDYQSCPRFGIWQMYAGPHALENTVQEMLGSAARLLTDDEYRAVITAYKAHPPVSAPGDRDGGGDGGQPAT
ncbi:MAG: hypothetical protein ACLPUG_06215 [Acidimicrobiales bacterium]